MRNKLKLPLLTMNGILLLILNNTVSNILLFTLLIIMYNTRASACEPMPTRGQNKINANYFHYLLFIEKRTGVNLYKIRI